MRTHRSSGPSLRRHAVAVVIPVVLALGAAGCVRAAPEVVTNGRLPDMSLTPISASCRIANDVAPNLQAMLAAATAAGVDLAPERSSYLPPGVPSPPEMTSCYRSYDLQVWWRSYYCSIGTCGLAAVPGTSRHGLGRAVDLDDQEGQMRFDSPGYAWLWANAGAYGFSQPLSNSPFGTNPEPWHWIAG